MSAPNNLSSLFLDYRRTNVKEVHKVHRGLDAAALSLAGIQRRRSGSVGRLRREAMQILKALEGLKSYDEAAIENEIVEIRSCFARAARPDKSQVRRALSLVCLLSQLSMGLTPFPVQVMGALALHGGFLAEMATGEGKTLTVALAAALAGWTGKPCHVITANDYLASRDAEWLGRFYAACSLTVGCVTGEMQPIDRAHGYAASVTYTTAKELLADFLRDRIALGNVRNPGRRLLSSLARNSFPAEGQFVMRGLHWAIVDEADNAMIDEAVTPLIIAAPVENDELARACTIAARVAETLVPGEDYDVDHKYQDIELRESAVPDSITQELPALWRSEARRAELIRRALVAREFYRRNKQYIVQDNKIELVDEFTGRIMPQRTWQQGLHQAVEAKEHLPITAPNETMASLSFQRFFRCFPKLAGVSGTAAEGAEEFWQIYRLAVVRIPTNRPCQRIQKSPRFFRTVKKKLAAVVKEIERLYTEGKPVLAGTRSIAMSEQLSEMLRERNLPHNLLNAVLHKEEAAIVAQAGQRGQITIATNMAGRGTDISLGEGVTALGGLHVLATEWHESGRIDRQLFGRSARQGDPGCAQIFASFEDDLIQRYLPPSIGKTLRGGGLPDFLAHRVFKYAQRMAERLNFRERRKVLKTDIWLDENLSFAGRGPAV